MLILLPRTTGELEPHTKPHHGFEKSLCDHYITIIFEQLGNLEALIQTKLNWKVL